MQILQFAQCLSDVLQIEKTLSLLAELLFGRPVLLEIKIAQIVIDPHIVVEVVQMKVPGLPNIVALGLGYRAGFIPSFANAFEFLE